MARYSGRHRISRRTKIATVGLGLALAVGGIAVVTTAGDPGQARADLADKSFFVDITTVQPNVDPPEEQDDASTGTFTVDCGKNENEHFNPDNFIAQPGVRNGAQHLHDYVGNLTTDADSNNQSLQAGGTTCENGDKSTYFWPVIRIEDEEEVAENEQQEQQNDQQQQQQQGQQNEDQQQNENQENAEGQNANNEQQGNNQQQNRNQNRNGGNQNADQDDNQRNNLVQGSLRQGQNRDNDQQGDRGGNGDRNQNNNDNNDDQQQQQQQQQGQNNNNDNEQNNNDNQDQDNQDQQEDNEEEAEAPPLDEPNEENELAGNDGEIQRPAEVDLTFRGSPTGDVEAMPKFLRILYGDAKVSTNGTANARDSWTCAGFEDRVLINKYPICPNGAPVKRIHDFASCWDGENIDSENHRDHIIYPQENGQCKDGFKAVPQLRITLTYNIPQEVQEQGRYKVDSFPEEEHNPFSDHDDFANVMSNQIMNRLVDCINEGRTCNE